ncbi:MAG: hypothetical protein RLZZ540_2131 [Bacteroidota bacterium]
MKNIVIVLSIFLTMFNTVSAQETTKKEVSKVIYVCPTHPDELNANSGKCPKCGMELVKVTEKIDTHALKGSQPKSKVVTKYVCPMDGSTSGTEGKCSKCGMGLVKVTEKVDNQALKGSQPKSKVVTKYICPMDGSTSDIKGECPKCGMKMTKKTNKN